MNIYRLRRFPHLSTDRMVEPDETNELQIDGVPLTERMYHFITALKRQYAFRDIRVGTLSPSSIKRDEVYLYYPDQLYALGKVGYRDYNVSQNSPIKHSYCIESRIGNNRKYRADSKESFWSLSTNQNRAIENAKRRLRPYTAEEIAIINSAPLSELAEGSREECTWARSRAFNALTEDTRERETSKIWQELLHLHTTGYTFTIDGLKDMIDDVIKACDEVAAMTTTIVNMSLIYATDSSHVTVIDGGPVQLNASVGKNVQQAFRDVDSRTVRCTMETLPEAVAEKVAVLSMLDNNTYLHGVGLRVNERVMYAFT